MIGDRAYDSDPLDQRLRKEYRIRLTAPHKFNRRRKGTQDGRELRRYCQRWRVERLFAWLHNFRRLVTRWEYHEANFLGMLQFGCLVILLRHSSEVRSPGNNADGKTARRDVCREGGERLRLPGLSPPARRNRSLHKYIAEVRRTWSPALRARARPERVSCLAWRVCAAMAAVSRRGATRAASYVSRPSSLVSRC